MKEMDMNLNEIKVIQQNSYILRKLRFKQYYSLGTFMNSYTWRAEITFNKKLNF